jgi:hypothetical protein
VPNSVCMFLVSEIKYVDGRMDRQNASFVNLKPFVEITHTNAEKM